MLNFSTRYLFIDVKEKLMPNTLHRFCSQLLPSNNISAAVQILMLIFSLLSVCRIFYKGRIQNTLCIVNENLLISQCSIKLDSLTTRLSAIILVPLYMKIGFVFRDSERFPVVSPWLCSNVDKRLMHDRRVCSPAWICIQVQTRGEKLLQIKERR